MGFRDPEHKSASTAHGRIRSVGHGCNQETGDSDHGVGQEIEKEAFTCFGRWGPGRVLNPETFAENAVVRNCQFAKKT